MALPDLPPFFDMIYVNSENGRLTPDGYLYNDDMFQTLNLLLILINKITQSTPANGDVTVNGLTPPSFTTAEIAAFGADATVPLGTIWRDSTINKLKFKASAGTIETITSV